MIKTTNNQIVLYKHLHSPIILYNLPTKAIVSLTLVQNLRLTSNALSPIVLHFIQFNGRNICFKLIIYLNNNGINIKYRSKLQNKSGIYAVINLITGQMYIGKTVNLFKRLREHINSGKSNIRLQNAINKYGITNLHLVLYLYAKIL
jgi:hypothetical protein